MNINIKTLLDKINTKAHNIASLQSQLSIEYTKVFDADLLIQDLIKMVHNTKPGGYQFTEFGDIEEWYRVDLTEIKIKYSTCLSDLKEYLSVGHFINLDLTNSVASFNLGPEEIIINEEGDIFCANKCIINKEDYEDQESRNALIEVHMEKIGYFPGVFKQDRYGNITLINTRKVL